MRILSNLERLYAGLFLWRRILSPRSQSRRLSIFDQPAPHPSPLPEERELVIGGATALTQAMVSRGESFDLRGGVAAIDPSTQPAPQALPRECELLVTKTPPSKPGSGPGPRIGRAGDAPTKHSDGEVRGVARHPSVRGCQRVARHPSVSEGCGLSIAPGTPLPSRHFWKLPV